MADDVRGLVESIHHIEIDRLRAASELPDSPDAEPTTPYFKLPNLPVDNPYHVAWKTYRGVLGELLAGGHAGSWILIRHEAVLGVYPSAKLAVQAMPKEGVASCSPYLIKQIRADELNSTLERLKSPCPASPIPLAKTA